VYIKRQVNQNSASRSDRSFEERQRGLPTGATFSFPGTDWKAA
jgi:hypothetical protein